MSAWLKCSLDPVQGNDRRKEQYWNDVVDTYKADHSGGSPSKFASSSFPTPSLSTVPNSASTVSNSVFAPSFTPSTVDGLRSHAGERGRKVREKKNNIFTF